MSGDIFLAIPAHRGAEVLAETLRSIRDQTYPRFHALISLDGPDDETAAVARPFLADPRFELIVQPERLGWRDHFNWMVRRCDRPFFSYWQQDDLAATNYLAELRRRLEREPGAAIAYADVQWFGRLFDRASAASVVGAAAQRVLDCIEGVRFEPLRGLIRADLLPTTPALDPASDEGCHAEFPFLARLAARGSFLRTEATLYFKRAHPGNTFGRWHSWPAVRRRRAWIDMGLGFQQVANEVFGPTAQRRLLAFIIDRLAVPREGRSYFSPPATTPAALVRFVRDFLDRGGVRLTPEEHPHPLEAFCPPVDPRVAAAMDVVAGQQALRQSMPATNHLDFTDGRGQQALGFGWSGAEPWGVWSDGPDAVLHLPTMIEGRHAVRLEGRHHPTPGSGAARIGWRHGDAEGQVEVSAGVPASFILHLTGRHPLVLSFPDAVHLPDLGSDDPRTVGWGLTGIALDRA